MTTGGAVEVGVLEGAGEEAVGGIRRRLLVMEAVVEVGAMGAEDTTGESRRRIFCRSQYTHIMDYASTPYIGMTPTAKHNLFGYLSLSQCLRS